jgi:hypothetical protein
MILAYVQKLFLLLCKHDIADLTREAGEKSIGALHYGDKHSCEQILDQIRQSQVSMAENRDIANEMQRRAQLIAEQARFRNEDDAIPAPATISTVFEFCADGTVRTSTVDLMGADYWGLSSALSR